MNQKAEHKFTMNGRFVGSTPESFARPRVKMGRRAIREIRGVLLVAHEDFMIGGLHVRARAAG